MDGLLESYQVHKGGRPGAGFGLTQSGVIALREPNLDLPFITEDSFKPRRILLWIFLTSFCDIHSSVDKHTTLTTTSGHTIPCPFLDPCIALRTTHLCQ